MPEFAVGLVQQQNVAGLSMISEGTTTFDQRMQTWHALLIEDFEALDLMAANDARFRNLNEVITIAPISTTRGTQQWSNNLMVAMSGSEHICTLAAEAGLQFVNCGVSHDQ